MKRKLLRSCILFVCVFPLLFCPGCGDLDKKDPLADALSEAHNALNRGDDLQSSGREAKLILDPFVSRGTSTKNHGALTGEHALDASRARQLDLVTLYMSAILASLNVSGYTYTMGAVKALGSVADFYDAYTMPVANLRTEKARKANAESLRLLNDVAMVNFGIELCLTMQKAETVDACCALISGDPDCETSAKKAEIKRPNREESKYLYEMATMSCMENIISYQAPKLPDISADEQDTSLKARAAEIEDWVRAMAKGFCNETLLVDLKKK